MIKFGTFDEVLISIGDPDLHPLVKSAYIDYAALTYISNWVQSDGVYFHNITHTFVSIYATIQCCNTIRDLVSSAYKECFFTHAELMHFDNILCPQSYMYIVDVFIFIAVGINVSSFRGKK